KRQGDKLQRRPPQREGLCSPPRRLSPAITSPLPSPPRTQPEPTPLHHHNRASPQGFPRIPSLPLPSPAPAPPPRRAVAARPRPLASLLPSPSPFGRPPSPPRNMKLRTKRPGWKSLVPLQLSRKSTMRFFLFPKVQASGQSPNDTPVYLNVYDLTPMNGYIYWAGLGIFHSGIEVHGVEYAFGAHDYPTSGVFEVEPRQCPGFRFRRSIFLGYVLQIDRQQNSEMGESARQNRCHLQLPPPGVSEDLPGRP
uniref:PPPDE domain-containing protein n=1 Tax=Aegilops tauschii subsp. strangulata TaxID=200361 RepID=A0A453IQX5_AEGTS